MHLTNYAINKNSGSFVKSSGVDDDSGHKRSLTAIWEYLEEHEPDFDRKKLWDDIQEIAVKTLITAQPSLCHSYRSC